MDEDSPKYKIMVLESKMFKLNLELGKIDQQKQPIVQKLNILAIEYNELKKDQELRDKVKTLGGGDK